MTWDASFSPLFPENDIGSRMMPHLASPPLDTIHLPMEVEQQHIGHSFNLDRKLRLEKNILPLEKFARGSPYLDTKDFHDLCHDPFSRVIGRDTAGVESFYDHACTGAFNYPSPSSYGVAALDVSSISGTERSPSPRAVAFGYSPPCSVDAGTSFPRFWSASGDAVGYGSVKPRDVHHDAMYAEPVITVQPKVSQIYDPCGSLCPSQGEILNDDVDADGELDALCVDCEESKMSPTIYKSSKKMSPKTKKSLRDRDGSRRSAAVTASPLMPKSPIVKRVASRKSSQSSKSNKARGSVKEMDLSATDPAAANRMYICSFKRYGCDSTFSAKNEWKRHIWSQHLKIDFYRCDLKGCDDTHKGPNDFNRKDLFIQHLRRMHTPWPGKAPPSSAEKNDFEGTLDGHAVRCVHKLRDPPARTNCAVCGKVFMAWQDRMEHMSKHYEKDSQFEEVRDPDLEAWAQREGILTPRGSSSDALILAENKRR
ncbi:C2H2 finger domain protein, putative [Talaromyces stipitatus ATCC 10500]|uniref:C2H2 finger domain protein, putative n=1 Tax=Talaromyces stipitatus (strain ATCC 10500 / CBS 375.48 / QM 6759 / NRRL 1006) TaxID=441959 RepID=B8MQ96_TALSN|nr:C2H2 finger domain protein, putative [Talaromyces stipitatus ATCC 10500]EED13243.1 C2H2 finger domain protein, putative [Talaromyces stipitatus ATCC 10500]